MTIGDKPTPIIVLVNGERVPVLGTLNRGQAITLAEAAYRKAHKTPSNVTVLGRIA